MSDRRRTDDDFSPITNTTAQSPLTSLYSELHAQEGASKKWLAEHWSDWQDASAYWD